jgi:hypothetical protein
LHIGVCEDLGANAVLGDFLLIEQRWLTRLVRQRDLSSRGGQRFEHSSDFARPVTAQRPHRLQHKLWRRIADDADLVMELDRETVLAAGLEKLDEAREIRRQRRGRGR